MDIAQLSRQRMHPTDANSAVRAHAEKTASEFEQLFVRSMVTSLRQTSAIGEGGMFGSGPGSDTFGDWFDQNLADQIGRDGQIGVARQVIDNLERRGDLARDLTTDVRAAQSAAARSGKESTPANGGIDVVL
jgi:Rod binding domain-containing protein